MSNLNCCVLLLGEIKISNLVDQFMVNLKLLKSHPFGSPNITVFYFQLGVKMMAYQIFPGTDSAHKDVMVTVIITISIFPHML